MLARLIYRIILGAWHPALLVISLLALLSPSSPAAAGACGISRETEARLIEANKDVLRSRLKDPSPVYEGLYVNCSGGGPVVCGTFNARNSYGGYVGWQRWIGALYHVSTEQTLGPNFERLWFKHCVG